MYCAIKNKAKWRPKSAPRFIRNLWMNVFDEWMNEWSMNEWINEWMNEWMNVWKWMWWGIKGDKNEEIRQNEPFCAFQTFAWPTNRPTDRPTNRPTDMTSYRSARTHLKTKLCDTPSEKPWLCYTQWRKLDCVTHVIHHYVSHSPVFSRVHATLHFAVSVGRSVSR